MVTMIICFIYFFFTSVMVTDCQTFYGLKYTDPNFAVKTNSY